MRRARIPLWAWWSFLILIVSLPWIGFTPRPQWNRVHPVPFTDPEDTPRDLALNVALFVPFGFWFAGGRRRSQALAQAAVAAAVVSLVAETPQLFSTMRNPSATDVFSAIVGGSAGAALRLVWSD